jgi:mannuronan 5-epimerase
MYCITRLLPFSLFWSSFFQDDYGLFSNPDYGLSDDSDRNGEDTTIGTPRPYITVEAGATGTMDINNSEIAYLGYEAGYGAGRTGLRYEGGDGSIIKGNNIHD